MDRRDFAKSALVALPGLSLTNKMTMYGSNADEFKLNYAPHFGMFENSAGKDVVDQLKFMHDQGFRSLEDNGMKGRSVKEQERIASAMGNMNMQMGVFVAHEIAWGKPNLTNGDVELRDKFLREIRESVDVAKRVNAKWMTVVPGFVDLSLEMAYQTANVIDALRRATEILEPHGLVIVLEPLNWWANHAGQFLTKIP
ncbi:MAG: TIM barrel protein, partial [Cyclobacteriaceae bacterium]